MIESKSTSKKEIEEFCKILEEEIQEENSEIDIKFFNQKDMWFIISCQYHDSQKDDNIDLVSKVDINLDDTESEISERIRAEISSLLNKKKILEQERTK